MISVMAMFSFELFHDFDPRLFRKRERGQQNQERGNGESHEGKMVGCVVMHTEVRVRE